MLRTIKEWLSQYTYTKYLVKLNKYKKDKIELPTSDQLAIIKILKELGATKCRLELYQKPKSESWNLNMSELEITNKNIIVRFKNPSLDNSHNRKNTFELDHNKFEHATISLENFNTMVFEVSDSAFNNSFYTKLKITLPTSLDELIEKSKSEAIKGRKEENVC